MLQALKRQFIKRITRVYDPVTTINIGNQIIKLPLSHQLREIVKVYPDYNFNLPRIVKYVSDLVDGITVIDIGSNVGDTVAFIKNFTDVPILCVDGNHEYMKLLKENTAQYQNVFSCTTLVGAETKEMNLNLKSEKGTAYIEAGEKAVSVRTLENILNDFPEFKNSKFIKSDTDGFDTIILRSCSNYLKNIKPILFFEFDPYLIKKNNDDALEFINFLTECNYQYFIFYVNNGDYLLSCSANEKETIKQLVDYFSGRNLELFADVCAFSSDDKHLFDLCKNNEIEHFKKARNY